MVSNVLNNLVEYGKADVRTFVADMLSQMAESDDRAEHSRIADRMFSLMMLSIKKAPPDIDVTDIRTLIIEENFDILSVMAEHSPQIIQMFAIATGRVTQIAEYLAAIHRILPTLGDGDVDGVMRAGFESLDAALVALRRFAVRLYEDEDQSRIVLYGIRNGLAAEMTSATT